MHEVLLERYYLAYACSRSYIGVCSTQTTQCLPKSNFSRQENVPVWITWATEISMQQLDTSLKKRSGFLCSCQIPAQFNISWSTCNAFSFSISHGLSWRKVSVSLIQDPVEGKRHHTDKRAQQSESLDSNSESNSKSVRSNKEITKVLCP